MTCADEDATKTFVPLTPSNDFTDMGGTGSLIADNAVNGTIVP